MATKVKQIKKKKRKFTLVGKISIITSFVIVVYFLSATVLKSYNGNLQNAAQDLNVSLIQEQEKVDALEQQVQALKDPKRIQEKANTAGLESHPENVINLPGEE